MQTKEMPHIKQHFGIKDMESLSGIKAHTIRVWEKRYGILQPERTETNIRNYNIAALQKILNIVFLKNSGYKISRVSKFSDAEIKKLVRTISTSNYNTNRAVKSLKLAMFNFDQAHFMEVYKKLSTEKSFGEIFREVFMPLLDEIGLLWQTDVINPSHEHFISNLIRQKLYVNIEKLNMEKPNSKEPVFILFMPEEEIHELGLLFVQYELLLRGYKTIYLGSTISLNELVYLSSVYQNAIFVSYFTIRPKNIAEHIEHFNRLICDKKKHEYWIMGQKLKNSSQKNFPKNIVYFKTYADFVSKI